MAGTVVVHTDDDRIDRGDQPVDLARWSALAQAVVSDLDADRGGGRHREMELTVLFVDEDRMADLNHTHLGEDGPTDVLSFPIDGDALGSAVLVDRAEGPAADGPPLLLGDVVICPAVAARNAPSHAGTYEDELALLLVHGILHLLGHDHAEPDEERAMQSHERKLLDRHHRAASAGDQ